jgi:hypothetical protein
MGQITLAVTGTTVGNFEFTADVSSADSARIVAAFGARYGIVPNSAEAVATILRTWFKMVIDNARADVLAHEQQAAARAASEAVQIIPVVMAGGA